MRKVLFFSYGSVLDWWFLVWFIFMKYDKKCLMNM